MVSTQYRTLFEVAPVALLSTDDCGTIQEANQAAQTLFSLGRDRLVGTPLPLLVVTTHRDAVRRALDNACTRRPSEFVVTLDRGSRTRLQVALRAVAVPPSEPEETTVHWSARNVTALERTKAALEQRLANERAMAQELRAVNELRDTCVTAVAHDLRSPLTALLGLADVLRTQHTLDETRRKELIDQIHDTATEMATLVTDVLDLARAEHSVMPIDRVEVDIGTVVTQAVARVVAKRPAPGPRVELDVRQVVARVDPRLVQLIVNNLVTNALGHAPGCQHVWIRVQDDASGVLLVVEDDGPGISDDAKRHVFDAFKRGDRSAGLGVGLELVRRFAAFHGGWAKVEDRAGGGTTFRVLIPDRPSA